GSMTHVRSFLPAHLCLRILLRAHHFDSDKRLIAFNPCIMARRNRVRHTVCNRDLRAVVRPHGDPAGHGIAHVTDLAAVGVDYRLDALRPPPARLEDEPSKREALQAHHFAARLARGPDFRRLLVGFRFKLRHDHSSRHVSSSLPSAYRRKPSSRSVTVTSWN